MKQSHKNNNQFQFWLLNWSFWEHLLFIILIIQSIKVQFQFQEKSKQIIKTTGQLNIHQKMRLRQHMTQKPQEKTQETSSNETDSNLFNIFGVINKCEGMDDYWNSLSFVFCLNPVIWEVVGCR